MDRNDDDYAAFGTPLPDLDEDDIVRKKVVEDLTVRDDKGRQRFHGAFTGGFSAGYFNTVGTKEGWSPSTFISSRAKKSETNSFKQNPEDFMDDEDFGAFGIAPKKIQTTSDFRDSSATDNNISKKRKYQSFDQVVIPGEPPLKDLIKPVVESIGIAILKKMGWRHGQGIGPRVTKRDNVKVYGCSMGPLAPNTGESSGDVLSAFTFAPEDSPDIMYSPKDDFHGIGYTGLSTQCILGVPQSEDISTSTTKSWLAKDKRKLMITGQAFGVGALEEDDDYEIYSKDDMSQYDFSEFSGETKTKKNSTGDRSKKEIADNVLDGFCLVSKPPAKKKQFPPPELPHGYHPMRKLSSSKIPTSSKSVSMEITKQKLDPNVRSILLGEKKFVKPAVIPSQDTVPSPRKSRFDVAPGQSTNLPPPGVLVSSDFKPFSRDKDKQKRYEEFLQYNSDKDHLRLIQPVSMTEWEKQQELDEFVKTSSFYQPMSKALSSHFVSTSDLHMDLVPVLPEIKTNKPRTVSDATSTTESNRQTLDWHPSSLLCRRFNIPNPYPDSQHEGVPNQDIKKTSLFECISIEGMEKDVPMQHTVSSSLLQSSPSNEHPKSKHQESTNKEIKIKDSPANVLLDLPEDNSNKKPSMDLFKDIFQTSSSEESEHSDIEIIAPEVNKSPEIAVSSSIIRKENKEASESSVPNKKVAFGVFANLDLDALNKKRNNMESIETEQKSSDNNLLSSNDLTLKSSDEVNNVSAPSVSDTSFYGPAPPPPGTMIVSYSPRSPTRSRSSSSHKHKHHKHKVKKKKKTKHHRKYKESSDSDSDADVPAEKIIEKLKELQKLGKSYKKKSRLF